MKTIRAIYGDTDMRTIVAAGGVNLGVAAVQITIYVQLLIGVGTLYLIGRKIWKEHRRD